MLTRIATSGLLALSALAIGCAHRSATAGTTSALACDRARSEAEANSVRRAGAHQAAATDRLIVEALYDRALVDYRAAASLASQARGMQSRDQWGSGFGIRESHAWAEQCRLARERERVAALERQQLILTPPHSGDPPR